MKIIPKKDLVKNRWYIGAGRDFYIAFWDGKLFHSFNYRFKILIQRDFDHFEENGCFAPFKLIEIPKQKNIWDF